MSASSSEIAIIKIKDQVDKNLSLRIYADNFFEFVESLNQNEILIDFEGVISASRSFAQEFLNLVKASHKDITIINQTDEIDFMLKAVQYPRKKTRIF